MRTQSILLGFIAFGLANREWLVEVGYVIIIDNKTQCDQIKAHIHLERTAHLRCIYLSATLRRMLFHELNYANTHFDEVEKKNDLLIERKCGFTYVLTVWVCVTHINFYFTLHKKLKWGIKQCMFATAELINSAKMPTIFLVFFRCMLTCN